MHLSEFDFDLPEALIASFPLEKRDKSRLLHYSRASGALGHRQFEEISEILKEGDILVRNTSKVLALRFYIKDSLKNEVLRRNPPNKNFKEPLPEPRFSLGSGLKNRRSRIFQWILNDPQNSSAEILLTENLDSKKILWSALVKPGKKIKESKKIFHIANQIPINVWREGDNFFVEFNSADDFEIAVRDFGLMPLPPYMKRDASGLDKERYQTIYAQEHSQGASIAAPTAGLHFTEEVNKKLQAKGIKILDTCLHVGLGTFMPIRTDEIKNHDMHEEYFEISPETWQTILEAKKEKRRIIAVGSTSTRVLETVASNNNNNLADKSSWMLKGKTKIFIYPGYEFKIIDGLITNFHLPKSTLILMISAFLGADKVKEIYQEAIEQKYRFYSYGDCCFFE